MLGPETESVFFERLQAYARDHGHTTVGVTVIVDGERIAIRSFRSWAGSELVELETVAGPLVFVDRRRISRIEVGPPEEAEGERPVGFSVLEDHTP